jgi:orotate phosphoribosyltransferase
MTVVHALPSRRGHFRLESGFHTDVWITLDALFNDPQMIGERVDQLAQRLRPYGATAVCGPFVGGALLALLLAERLRIKFFYAELQSTSDQMFGARYELRRSFNGSYAANALRSSTI